MWILFGAFVEIVYLGLAMLFFKIQIPANFLSSLVISAALFGGLRVVIDWREFRNSLSREVRERIVSTTFSSGLLFSMIGGVIILVSNSIPVGGNSGQVFLLGALCVSFCWLLFDETRQYYNSLFLTASKLREVNPDEYG